MPVTVVKYGVKIIIEIRSGLMRRSIIISMLFVLAGCSTIIRGSKQTISTNSEPMGAVVLLNGVARGTTPVSVELPRNGIHTITIRKDGYEDIVISFDRQFEAGTTIIGNLFSWSLIGVVVDLASGSAYTLHPQDAQAMLSQTNTPASVETTPNTITVHFFSEEEFSAYKNSVRGQ